MTAAHRQIRWLLTLPWLLAGLPNASGQVANPYYLNGSATQDNCNCYTLTQDLNSINGSVWNIYKISLRDTLDFSFSVYLGSTDANGADGIAFVLQPISTQIGTLGGGLGFQGVTPSIGITIDTWQNTDLNDPAFDHIAIQRNGNLNHAAVDNLAGPVSALAGSDNIEDGRWHMLRVRWDPSTRLLRASMDGVDRVSATIDLVSTVFNSDPMVYWGFTASTGGARNLQRFCTALDPQIKSLTGVETCFGRPIAFRDSSSSFSKIVKWFWDFGDGTRDTLQNPPPHSYPAPGRYTLRLNILGNNGCLSDTLTKEVVVGSEPFANIRWTPVTPCAGSPLIFSDSSSVAFGTVNTWNWNIAGNTFSSQSPTLPSGLPAGNYPVSLQVRTQEGCISSPVASSVTVRPLPSAGFIGNLSICSGQTVTLDGSPNPASPPIARWFWKLPGVTDSTGPSLTRNFPIPGLYPVSMQVRGTDGCLSQPAIDTIRVFSSKAFAGKDTLVAGGVPFQLQGSGGATYRWDPPTGLSNPNIPNPTATLTSDMTYVLTATTPVGCLSTDTINIRVFKGPDIYVPTAFSPNADGLNDILRAFPVGVRFQYLHIYDRWGGLVFSTTDHRIGWDGTSNGKRTPPGTFAWSTEGELPDGRKLFRKGTLQLIR